MMAVASPARSSGPDGRGSAGERFAAARNSGRPSSERPCSAAVQYAMAGPTWVISEGNVGRVADVANQSSCALRARSVRRRNTLPLAQSTAWSDGPLGGGKVCCCHPARPRCQCQSLLFAMTSAPVADRARRGIQTGGAAWSVRRQRRGRWREGARLGPPGRARRRWRASARSSGRPSRGPVSSDRGVSRSCGRDAGLCRDGGPAGPARPRHRQEGRHGRGVHAPGCVFDRGHARTRHSGNPACGRLDTVGEPAAIAHGPAGKGTGDLVDVVIEVTCRGAIGQAGYVGPGGVLASKVVFGTERV